MGDAGVDSVEAAAVEAAAVDAAAFDAAAFDAAASDAAASEAAAFDAAASEAKSNKLVAASKSCVVHTSGAVVDWARCVRRTVARARCMIWDNEASLLCSPIIELAHRSIMFKSAPRNGESSSGRRTAA